MKYSEYDFRHAKLILDDLGIRQEIEEILRDLNTPLGRNVDPTPSKQHFQIKVGKLNIR